MHDIRRRRLTGAFGLLFLVAAVGTTAQVTPLTMRNVTGRVVVEGAAAQQAPTPAPPRRTTADTLPAQISDAEFWRMIAEFSETGGTYPYENFVSNEHRQQIVIPALKQAARTGEVYIGVGPEQNFTYASVLQAKMAFVIDIRRQNMLEHLLYKALFELSTNRADFVSRLFSRKRPAGLDNNADAKALFAAYENAKNDADLYLQNLDAVKNLFKTHGYKLTSEDLLKIDYVYQVFYRGGPAINYEFASASPAASSPTYTQIMNLTDTAGKNWSYLNSEQSFQYLREMQRKNLFIPLVGDFSGPAAIRNVARYLKEHNANVSAFYASNVESYLDDRQLQSFYASLLTLPTDSTSQCIRYVDFMHNTALPSWATGGSYIQVVSPMSDLTFLARGGGLPPFHALLGMVKDPAPGGLPRLVLPLSLGPGKPFLSIPVNPETNGSFQIGLPIGQIQVGAPTGLSPGLSIKSITFGSTDLLREPLNLTPADRGELLITLTATSGVERR